jgi:hypothetical protein
MMLASRKRPLGAEAATVAVQQLALQLIEVLISNLGPKIDFPDRVIRGFLQSLRKTLERTNRSTN